VAGKIKINAWDSCTWSGARREQSRRWGKLSLREKLKAVEEMGAVAARLAKMRRSSRPAAQKI
jgi:hypothetical protein